jgi:hypothetical protein
MYGRPADIKALQTVGLWERTTGTEQHGDENIGRDGYLPMDHGQPFYTAHNLEHMEIRAKRAKTSAERKESGRRGGLTTAARRNQTDQQTDQFAEPPPEQTGRQNDGFATQFASENPSKTEANEQAPETRDQEPTVSTSSDHHHLRDTRYDDELALKRRGTSEDPEVMHRCRELLELAVKVVHARASTGIQHDINWMTAVRSRIIRDHGTTWTQAICADVKAGRQHSDYAPLIAIGEHIPLDTVRDIINRLNRGDGNQEAIPA